MMRPSVIVLTLSMLAAGGGLAYLHMTRERASDEAASSSEPASRAAPAVEPSLPAVSPPSAAVANRETAAQPVSSSGEMKSSNENVATPDNIAQWIKDTESMDAKARAAAIAALADAPKAQAMPALKRVLQAGEPNVDRHIALRSLYTLALRDGDTNGQIRDVMRHAIYHGDDDGVTQTAQSLLDDIEAEFSQREQDSQ